MNRIRNTLLASDKPAPTTRLCDWLGQPRSTAYYQPRERKARPVDEAMATRIKLLYQTELACGVRGTWSRLRFPDGINVNLKKVHRIMKLKSWTLPKPRHCKIKIKQA